MPTSTSRSDQCSNRTEISGAHARAKVHTSGWIRAGQAHEGVVIRDRRSAKAPYCCLSHQENTADSEGSRCRKKLLCTTCSSCAFIIVLIHGCFHHTHFGGNPLRTHSAVFCSFAAGPRSFFLHVEASSRNFEREYPETCCSNDIHGLNGMTWCRSGLARRS